VFKDDGLFYKEFCRFIKKMPVKGDMSILIFDQLFGELQGLESSEAKDTSKSLQEKSTILFLLAHISASVSLEDRLKFLQLLLTTLDKQLLELIKYPIQERYLALLYFSLSKLAPTLNLKRSKEGTLPLKDLNSLFIHAFGGYSS
jgi:hypothetical protein